MVDRAHYTAEMLVEFRPAVWEEMLGMRVFSVARDPRTRALSAYRQFRGHFGGSRLVRSFEDYLRCVRDELYRTERDGYLYIHGAPQSAFLTPRHELLRGGDLSEGLSRIFGRELRFSSDERAERVLSRREAALVEDVYRGDLEMWHGPRT